MAQEHILVVDDSEMVTQMMRVILTRLGYSVTLKTSPKDALKWLKIPGNLPELVISDVMMPEMSGQEFIGQIRSDPLLAHMPIILLTGNGDTAEKISGFQAGTDDYLVKPVDPTELDLRVKALLTRAKTPVPSRAQSEAVIITVFALRGGVGKTSIAVNLSAALAYLWGIEVPLLDFALKNGHCSLMLNLKSRYTIYDLVEWETPTVDVETIEGLLLRHETGIRHLPAPLRPEQAERITPTVVDRVWSYLRASYPFMVIDSGSELSELSLTALERSHVILLVLAPELASIKAATDAIRLFEQLGFNESARILPVINWTFPKSGLSEKNIAAALNHQIAGVIPYDQTAFVNAINTGQTAFSADPSSQSSLAIATLAYQLSQQKMKGQECKSPKVRDWVSRLAKTA